MLKHVIESVVREGVTDEPVGGKAGTALVVAVGAGTTLLGNIPRAVFVGETVVGIGKRRVVDLCHIVAVGGFFFGGIDDGASTILDGN